MALKIGDQLTLTISDVAFGGEGVARVDDFVVFVPFVLPGEVVEAEVTEVKKSFARARLLRVAQASPERVEPACRYFGAVRRMPISACGLRRSTSHQAQTGYRFIPAPRRTGRAEIVAPVVPCPKP